MYLNCSPVVLLLSPGSFSIPDMNLRVSLKDDILRSIQPNVVIGDMALFGTSALL